MRKYSMLPVAAVLLFMAACSSPEKEAERPNILFCIADDQSFPHAGAYGCEWVKDRKSVV